MNYEQLKASVADGAALRLRQRLQPVGGAGDIVFPLSYPGKGHHEQALHVKANEHSLIQFNRQARRFSTGLFRERNAVHRSTKLPPTWLRLPSHRPCVRKHPS
jgi:hypothetical protein